MDVYEEGRLFTGESEDEAEIREIAEQGSNKTPSEFNSNQPSKIAESSQLRSISAVVSPMIRQERSPISKLNGSQKQVLPKKRFTVSALFNKRKTDAATP